MRAAERVSGVICFWVAEYPSIGKDSAALLRFLTSKGHPMAQTKFSAGQRVSVMRGTGFGAPPGMFRVVSALPLESGPQQYRVRADGENFDRIVEETRLEAASYG
jgi:hypothetical protein